MVPITKSARSLGDFIVIKLFKQWYRKIVGKKLRDAVVDAYGVEFGEMYVDVNMGVPIGDIRDTIIFLEAVEKVKNKLIEDGWRIK